MSARLLSLDHAAKLLGTTRPALLRSMREAGHMHGTAACAELVKAGLFKVEQEVMVLDNGVRKPYQVTKVTLQGLAWLDQRINGNNLRKVS